MALACKKTKRGNKSRLSSISETPHAKYEAAPGASQKIQTFFGYLKIR
jgi:hypothetical protein